MEELKRCPFCGGEAAQEAGKDLYGEFECVYCKECSACIKADTKEEAIAEWNNRKPVNVVLERLEKKIKPLHNPNWNAAIEESIQIIKGELL